MTGVPLTRRYISWRARDSRRRIGSGSKKAALTFWQDLVTPSLVPIKTTFFFIMGATQCVLPYATPFMRELGLTVEETAVIFTISPIIPVFAPFLAGIITDKIGNFRLFLVITVAVSGVFSLVHIAIPPARTMIDEPEPVELFSTCYRGNLRFHLKPEEGCSLLNETVTLDRLVLDQCGYFCPEPPPIIVGEAFRESLMGSTITNFHNSTFTYSCNIESDYSQKCYIQRLPNVGVNVHLNIPSQLTLNEVELHLEGLPPTKDIAIPPSSYKGPNEKVLVCDIAYETETIRLPRLVITAQTNKTAQHFQEKVPIKPYSGCFFHCKGELLVKDVCTESQRIIDHNINATFYSILVCKIIGALLVGFTYSMFESAVISILKENNYDYGFQRIYGSIGGMIFAPITGLMIDGLGKDHYSDYYVTFMLYFALKLVCAVLLLRMDLQFKLPSSNICGDIGKIFRNIECVLLIIAVFVSGMCYGFIENFLPWYLRDLGAANWLIGSMTTVASVASIPFLAFSGFISKKFGYVQSISFGLICYSVRCIGYSSIINPNWCLPFELLEGVTTGLLIATAIIYGAKLSHRGNVGTMQGILATFHYGFGKSLGSLSGGFIMARLSARIAFRVYAGFAFLLGFCYYIFFKLNIQPQQIRNEKRKQEVAEMQVEVVPTTSNQQANKPKKETSYKFRPPYMSSSSKKKDSQPEEKVDSSKLDDEKTIKSTADKDSNEIGKLTDVPLHDNDAKPQSGNDSNETATKKT